MADRERERFMTDEQRAWLHADRRAAELAQESRYAERAAERAADSEAARAIADPMHQPGSVALVAAADAHDAALAVMPSRRYRAATRDEVDCRL